MVDVAATQPAPHRAPATGLAHAWATVRSTVLGQSHEDQDQEYEAYPRWPVVLLAAGAFVAIWGGWVDLGRMAGFGPVNLLPGIVEFYVDLSITLPLGMEVYAAFALGVWLTHRHIRPAARRFAGWSVAASLLIGASGQVAYHLLSAAGIERAPVPVVVVVACVPVVVMGMGAALSHLLAPVRHKSRTVHAVAHELVRDDGMSPQGERPELEDSPALPTLAPVSQPVSQEPDQGSNEAEPRGPESQEQSHPAQIAAHEPADPADQGDALDRDERDRRILDLATSGAAGSERDLAELVPCSRSTVNRVLRAHGVTLGRPPARAAEWATSAAQTA